MYNNAQFIKKIILEAKMNQTKRDVLKNIIITIILIVVVLLLILGVQNSDFSKLKKYNISKSQGGFFGSKADSVEVSIVNKNQVNLGDFVFNVAENRKLIANISIIHKPKNSANLIDNASDEFIKKGTFLRDATINAMLESKNFEMNVNNNKIKDNIKNRLNKNLENSVVEEVYFNKFIIQ